MALARRTASTSQPNPPPAGQSVIILVYSVDESTGVARTMTTLANGLAANHDVEVVSLFRLQERPTFDLDPSVRLAYLEDTRHPPHVAHPGKRYLRARENPRRSDADRELDRQPSELFSHNAPTSALTDRALRDHLGAVTGDVLISNRPFLHQAAARWLPQETVLLATEHSTYDQRGTAILHIYRDNADRIDALVTVTEADRIRYDEYLARSTKVVEIPNAIPDQGHAVSPPDSKVIVAAGSLVPRKGFDRLIQAFAPIVPEHPDWQLHIYGKGGERAKLARLVAELAVDDNVVLKGFDPAYTDRLANAAVYALSSHFESFGMVIIEAMGVGVPVIAFDCPSGPRHLIRDGVDGLLIPNDDIPAFTAGLRRLVEDDDFRRSAGTAALETMPQYSVEAVVARWEALFSRR